MSLASGVFSADGNGAKAVDDADSSEDTGVTGSFNNSPMTSSAVIEQSIAASGLRAQLQAVIPSQNTQNDNNTGIDVDVSLAPTSPSVSSTACEVGASVSTTLRDSSECSDSKPSDELTSKPQASKASSASRSNRPKLDSGASALRGLFETGPSDAWPLKHGRVVCWIAGRPYTMLCNHETLKEVATEFGLRANDLLLVNAGLFPTLKLTSHLMSGTLLLLPWIEAAETDENVPDTPNENSDSSLNTTPRPEVENSDTSTQLPAVEIAGGGASEGESASNALGFHPMSLVNLSRVELQSLAVRIGAPAKVSNEDLRQALIEWHNAHRCGNDTTSSTSLQECEELDIPSGEVLPIESGVSTLLTPQRTLEVTHQDEKSLPGPVYRKAVVLLDDAGNVSNK